MHDAALPSPRRAPARGPADRSAADAPSREPADRLHRPPPPRLAVVIPTYGRAALLRRCLNAVLAQTLPPEAYEVIVVDDGHDDGVRALVDRLATQHPYGPGLRYLRPSGTRGPAAARNLGWRCAHAPIVAFTDDDTVPAPDWLEEGERMLVESPEVAAVAGAIEVPVEDAPTDHALNTRKLESAGFVTANCFVRRGALAQVGGFDQRFTRAWREDTDLFFTLSARDLPVIHAATPIVVHPVRPVPWGHAVRAHANLRFDALLYKKHPQMYRRHVRARPPWRYYAIVLLALAAAAALLVAQPLAAAAAALAWLLLTARFTAERLARTSPRAADRAEVIATSVAIPFVAVFWRLAGAFRWRVLFL